MIPIINALTRTATVQYLFILIEFIIVLFAEDQRKNVFWALALYLYNSSHRFKDKFSSTTSVEFLVAVANYIIFIFRISGTYPFKVGMSGVVFREFARVNWVAGIYGIIFLVCRAYAVVSILVLC